MGIASLVAPSTRLVARLCRGHLAAVFGEPLGLPELPRRPLPVEASSVQSHGHIVEPLPHRLYSTLAA